ncbi:hypothetical protein TSAR_004867 [Trichomalopsis sarcophagae]|uniref:Uncharacterized protein n=1 Tax=Trichomalopsis sarcophagae TaxID=543379 RepID=A0A232ENX5_9HYME|nr:hypothetical protein TSAR_004867 [Trichomalopsis sarcophagae]
MELTEESVKIPTTMGAYAFGPLLSVLLVKYVLYDNGFTLANLLLVAGVTYVRWFLLREKSSWFQDSAALILFVFFDKSLLNFGNVLLLLGIACIHEQFNMIEIAHVCKLKPKNPFESKVCPACSLIEFKEAISLACGLTLALLGWYSVGRVRIIYALIVFYYYYSLFLSMIWMNLVYGLIMSFWEFIKHMINEIKYLHRTKMSQDH